MATLSAASIIIWSVKSARKNASRRERVYSVFDGMHAHGKYHHGNLIDAVQWMAECAPYRLFYITALTRNGLYIRLPIRYSLEQVINDSWQLMDTIGMADDMPTSLAAVYDDQEIRRCIRKFYARQYAQGGSK